MVLVLTFITAAVVFTLKSDFVPEDMGPRKLNIDSSKRAVRANDARILWKILSSAEAFLRIDIARMSLLAGSN
jgi:hypothetical protein